LKEEQETKTRKKAERSQSVTQVDKQRMPFLDRRINGGDRKLAATLQGVLAGFCLAYFFMKFTSSGRPSPAWRILHTKDEQQGEVAFEEEEDINRTRLETSIVCIIAPLILITILFEEAREKIEESANRNAKPIIQSLFGEMTVLGFLSACTFIITKTPLPYKLSKQIFGEDEILVEIFEMVHFSLFFIMVIFVAQVLVLVRESMETEAKWDLLDRKRRYPATDNDSKEIKLFRALAEEFVLERSVEPPFDPADESSRLTSDFKFGRYLSICLGSDMGHIVHVSILSWVFFLLLTLCFYVLMLLLENDLEVRKSRAGNGSVSGFSSTNLLLYCISNDYVICLGKCPNNTFLLLLAAIQIR
jgi:hypothetical protein